MASSYLYVLFNEAVKKYKQKRLSQKVYLHYHKQFPMLHQLKQYLLSLTCLAFSFAGNSAPPLKPEKLTTEYLVNPLGIDVTQPRLSWTLVSGARAQKQSAYELIVSDNEKDIVAGTGTAWSSGKVPSSQSLHINMRASHCVRLPDIIGG
jgi:hypothetical protein